MGKKLKNKNNRPTIPKIVIGIDRDKEFFAENLSALVASGMPITDSLHSIAEDVRTKTMKKIIDYIIFSVNEGKTLWKTLEETKIFKENIISLIRIGEETGRLSDNLKVVAIQEQKSRMFASKIKTAMTYPVFVLVLSAVIGIFIAWFILPRLATVFSQLDVELPQITKILIDLGIFLQEKGSIVVPILLFSIILLLYFIFIFKHTKFIGNFLILKIPGVGRLVKEVEISRFGFLLGTLLEAGIPILSAVDSLKKSTKFKSYRKFYDHLEKSIHDGNSIKASFKSFKGAKKIIPTPMQQLISSSEQSGNLAETLKDIGALYEEKTEDTTKNLTVILEPVLLVVVWLGVVGVALAVILPIYSLIGGFNVG